MDEKTLEQVARDFINRHGDIAKKISEIIRKEEELADKPSGYRINGGWCY